MRTEAAAGGAALGQIPAVRARWRGRQGQGQTGAVPPYGLALLMASKFVGVRFSQALRASLSIYVVFFATIAASIFLPDVVLWLPKHLFPESVGCFKNPSGAGYICP